jgi:hypothetical protein
MCVPSIACHRRNLSSTVRGDCNALEFLPLPLARRCDTIAPLRSIRQLNDMPASGTNLTGGDSKSSLDT